jgi:SAM-dependent methyltransferase
VLLLRGDQAPGELRTRTDRLHAFPDRSDVEACLSRMASRPQPLVVQLPRRSGDRDARWRHLLGEPSDSDTSARPEPVREVQLDLAGRDDRVRATYDAVASAYADALEDELSGRPFERWLLQHVADLAAGSPVVEVGCGPGHVTAHLAQVGADVTGVDFSERMVAEARRRFPQTSYEHADLRALLRPPRADGWGAVVAWYSLIHFAPSELPEVLAGLVRPLRAGGWLVFGGHAGSGLRRITEWFGQAVEVDVVLHDPATVAAMFEAAGLTDVSWFRRGPLPGLAETTERCYVLGRTTPQNA